MRAILKKWLYQERRVLITATVAASTVILVRCCGLLQVWEWAAFDQFMRPRPAETTDNRIVIVAIGERDLQKYGYPISDGVMAQLLQKLNAGKPRAIGLDIYRDLPTPPGNAALLKTFTLQDFQKNLNISGFT